MPPKFSVSVTTVKCCKCNQTAYPQESITYDQSIYHQQSCFKCEICRSSLSLSAVAKLNNVLYCKPCFKKTFLREGRYTSFSGGSSSAAKPEGSSTAAPAPAPAAIPENGPAPAAAASTSADGPNPMYSRAGLRSTAGSTAAPAAASPASPFNVALKSTAGQSSAAASAASPSRPTPAPLAVESSNSILAAASMFGASNFGRNRAATTGPGMFSKSAPQSPTFSSQHGPFSVGKPFGLASKSRNSDPALDAILKGPAAAVPYFQQVGVVQLFEKRAGQTLLEYAMNNNKASAISLIDLLHTQVMVAENQLFSMGQRSPFSAAPIAAPVQDTPSTEVVSLDEIVGGN